MAFGALTAFELQRYMFKGIQPAALLFAPTVRLWIGNPGSLLIGGAEVAGPYATTGYQGLPTVFAEWTVIGGIVTNASAITFDEAKVNWGVVTHVVLTDTPGSVNCRFYGALTTPITIETGTVPRFAVGALGVSLD